MGKAWEEAQGPVVIWGCVIAKNYLVFLKIFLCYGTNKFGTGRYWSFKYRWQPQSWSQGVVYLLVKPVRRSTNRWQTCLPSRHKLGKSVCPEYASLCQEQMTRICREIRAARSANLSWQSCWQRWHKNVMSDPIWRIQNQPMWYAIPPLRSGLWKQVKYAKNCLAFHLTPFFSWMKDQPESFWRLTSIVWQINHNNEIFVEIQDCGVVRTDLEDPPLVESRCPSQSKFFLIFLPFCPPSLFCGALYVSAALLAPLGGLPSGGPFGGAKSCYLFVFGFYISPNHLGIVYVFNSGGVWFIIQLVKSEDSRGGALGV